MSRLVLLWMPVLLVAALVVSALWPLLREIIAVIGWMPIAVFLVVWAGLRWRHGLPLLSFRWRRDG